MFLIVYISDFNFSINTNDFKIITEQLIWYYEDRVRFGTFNIVEKILN